MRQPSRGAAIVRQCLSFIAFINYLNWLWKVKAKKGIARRPWNVWVWIATWIMFPFIRPARSRTHQQAVPRVCVRTPRDKRKHVQKAPRGQSCSLTHSYQTWECFHELPRSSQSVREFAESFKHHSNLSMIEELCPHIHLEPIENQHTCPNFNSLLVIRFGEQLSKFWRVLCAEPYGVVVSLLVGVVQCSTRGAELPWREKFGGSETNFLREI